MGEALGRRDAVGRRRPDGGGDPKLGRGMGEAGAT